MSVSPRHYKKVLTLKEKLDLINEFEEKKKKHEVLAQAYGIPRTTVTTILKNKEMYKRQICEKRFLMTRKRMRTSVHTDIDKHLLKWCTFAQITKTPISGAILTVKANKIATQLGKGDWTCSAGWLDRFKRRHNISFNKGEIRVILESESMSDHDDWEPLSESEMKLMQARRERSDKISKMMGDYLLKGYKMLATTCPECQTILLQNRQGVNYCVACSELDTDTGKDDPVINQTAAMSMAREMELASAAAAGNQSSSNPGGGGASANILPVQAVGSQHSPRRQGADGKRSVVIAETSGSLTSLSMTSIDVQSWPPNPTDLRPTAAAPTLKEECPEVDSGINSTMPEPAQSCPTLTEAGETLSFPSPWASSLSSSTTEALKAKISWARQELVGTHNVEYSIQLCQLIKTAAEAISAVRTARI